MGLYLGVAEASLEPAKFIHLVYRPKGEVKKKVRRWGRKGEWGGSWYDAHAQGEIKKKVRGWGSGRFWGSGGVAGARGKRRSKERGQGWGFGPHPCSLADVCLPDGEAETAGGRGITTPLSLAPLPPITPSAPTQVGIVGKGLTFDSGGYNIKAGPGSMIELMKFDMGGSAAALGAARILADTQPEGVEVRGR